MLPAIDPFPAPHPIIGVIGGSGGVGATTFAAVLAVTAGMHAGHSVLVDLDPASGGVDVLLGLEREPGARWSGLRLDGGYLEPGVLVDGLPRTGACSVLAADTDDVDPASVSQVVSSAVEAGPVVVDLARRRSADGADAVALCRLVILIARGDVAGLVAARTVAAALEDAPLGVLVRQGNVATQDAAGLVNLPLLGELPALGAPWPRIDLDRPPGALVTVARGVLAGADPTGRW